jgi:hypothetical protein
MNPTRVAMHPHHIVAVLVALSSSGPLLAQRSVPDQPRTTDKEIIRQSAGAAKVQLDEAIRRALASVPGVAVRATYERVRIDGRLVPRFEVEILRDDAFFDVQIDPETGGVTHVEEHAARSSDRLFQMKFDFEREELPAGFDPTETGGGGTPASWRTERAEDAPDGKRVLVVESQNRKLTFNLLMRRGATAADLTVSAAIKAWKGAEDQGGGLVWRAKDAANYYVARWNPLERNLRLYTVVDGKRSTPMKSVEIDADAAAWHELKVTMIGPRIVVRFDGKVVIEAEDATFQRGGAVGLWTKADASTRFDSFRVVPDAK